MYLDALVDSVREVWGHELTAGSFARADHRPGETAMPGVRHLLLGEGLERERGVRLRGGGPRRPDPFARERAGGTPVDETFLVGDTPRDVEGAHAAGARAIAVTTGEYDSRALAKADLVLPSIAELPAALAVC